MLQFEILAKLPCGYNGDIAIDNMQVKDGLCEELVS